MLGAVLATQATMPAVVSAACTVVSELSPLIRALEDGGYVILMRHADKYAANGSPRRPENLGRTLPTSCSNPRDLQVLNQRGVRQAKAIGAALSDVPISSVYASDAYRTVETAEIAFGRTPERYRELAQLLQSLPESGTNTAIVSHSNTIKDTLDGLGIRLGRKLSCGEAAIIDPDGDEGRPECVALVLAKEWRPSSGNLGYWQNRRECDRRR